MERWSEGEAKVERWREGRGDGGEVGGGSEGGELEGGGRKGRDKGWEGRREREVYRIGVRISSENFCFCFNQLCTRLLRFED